MSDYSRSTKEITLEGVTPDVMRSIKAYLEKYNLGNLLTNVSLCVLSTSEKLKKGIFSKPGPKLLVQTAILTDRWLILADRVDQNAIYVRTMQLRDITAEDYEKSPFHSKIPDTGMNISGRFTDTTLLGTFFLPLGDDAAGRKFKSALILAVQEAKK